MVPEEGLCTHDKKVAKRGFSGTPKWATSVLSPKTQIKRCFTLKMPDCCLNLLFFPCGEVRFPSGGWFVGWSRETYEWGDAQNRPQGKADGGTHRRTTKGVLHR